MFLLADFHRIAFKPRSGRVWLGVHLAPPKPE
jgi:hypothetical protein